MSRHDSDAMAYVGVAAVATAAMMHKRIKAVCDECGDTIYGKNIHRFWAVSEENKAAAEMAGIDPHARYCSECYASLKAEYDEYKNRAEDYTGVRTYSINYRGNTHTDDGDGIEYTTDEYDSRSIAEKVLRKVAAIYGNDAVTHLCFERSDDGKWTASGIICDFI